MAEAEAQWRLELKDLPNLRRLGRGLSGYFYETTWGGNKCARKDFPLGSAERNTLFEREVKKVCKLDDHPHVVKCFGYTVGRSTCSVLQEYVADNLQNCVQRKMDQELIRKRGSTSTPGPSTASNFDEIKRLVSSRGKVKEKGKRKVADAGAFEAVPEAADIISQIAAGMRHLHEDGVVHGDLKPRNVLVLNPDESGGWKVKLADYGLTETKKRIRMVSERTRRAEILTWKAPERLGRKKSDHGSPDGDFLTEFDVDSDEEIEHVDEFHNSKLAMADVYSFGLTCSYILSGKPMSSDMNLRQQRMKGFKPKLPESVSLEYLKFVIGACLDPEPLKRPAFFMICMMEVAPSHLRLQMLRDMMKGRWRESVPQIPCEIGLPGSLEDRSVDPPEQINNMSTFSGVPSNSSLAFHSSIPSYTTADREFFQMLGKTPVEDLMTSAEQEIGWQSGVTSDAALASSEKGVSHEKQPPDVQEPTITSLSSGYGARYAERPKEAAALTKREDAECQSDDGEEESVVTKERVTGRGSWSRWGTEIHNLNERQRRIRIKEKMIALRDLIPNSNKAKKASILDGAIEYLKMLQLQLQMMSIRTGMTLPAMVVPPGLQQHMQMPQMAAMPSMGMMKEQNPPEHNSSLFDVVGATSTQIRQGPFKSWREHVQISAPFVRKNDRINQQLLRRCIDMVKQIHKMQNPVLSSSAKSGVTQSTPVCVQPQARRPQAGKWIASEWITNEMDIVEEPLDFGWAY